MTGLLDEVGVCIGTLGPDPFVIAQDLPPVFDAVAAAGTTSVSLHTFLGAMHGVDTVSSMLSDRGLRAGALEAALAWSKGPGSDNVLEAEQVVAMSEALGAKALLTVVLEEEFDRGAAVEGLAQLCDLVAPAGVQVCLEWLPWTAMGTIATAVDLMVACGAPNAGLTFDTWHWMRQPGGPDLDTLATVDGSRICYLQLCDVAPVAADDVFAEAMTARQLLGDGIVDLAGVFDLLDTKGAHPYVATEIFNTAILDRGVREAALAFHESALRLRGSR